MKTPLIHFTFLQLLLIALLLPYLCVAGEMPKSIRYVGGQGLWPVIFQEQGTIKGIQPDIIRLMLQPYKIRMSIHTVPQARTLFEINNNNADATTVITYGELGIDDYPDFISVCETPLWYLSSEVIWVKGSPIEVYKVEDLDQYRIGMLNTTPGLLEKAGLHWSAHGYFHSIDAMVKSLVAGRVDVIIMDLRHAQAIANRLGVERPIQGGLKLLRLNMHLAIARHWASTPEQLDQLCQSVKELQQQGKFDSIVESYFSLH